MAERLIDMAPESRTARKAFIDLEASGLGSKSWPVEVGWAFGEGEPVAMLIKPDPTWTDDAWDPAAQELHGIDRFALEREGVHVREACAALNAAFQGAEVYSDAPDWDGFWLFRLFSAAGVRQAFALHDYGALIRRVAKGREEELFRQASRLAPRRHRAADDARHLQTLYRLAQ